MKNKKYMSIVDNCEGYFEKFGDTPKGVRWRSKENAETRYRVMTDIIYWQRGVGDVAPMSAVKLLDFGCGAGHLLEFIQKNDIPVEYTGLDLSKKFIDHCKKKFPNNGFIRTDVMDTAKIIEPRDYVVMNGVFTECGDLSKDYMMNHIFELLARAFAMAKHGVAFNLMSTSVDYRDQGVFYVKYWDAIELATSISRHFVLRHDYGLHDFTIYLFRE